MPRGRKVARAFRPRIENKGKRPSPQMTTWMRLPPDRIDAKRVAASRPQALGMVANNRLQLKTYWGRSYPTSPRQCHTMSRTEIRCQPQHGLVMGHYAGRYFPSDRELG